MTDASAASTLAARTRDFTLASVAMSYPGPEQVDVLGALRAELGGHPGLGPLVDQVAEGITGVQGAWTTCFDQGRERVAVYETEYGRMRGLAKGRDLADVVGFYEAFGFQLAQDQAAELPDHVAIELEFYALLLHKQALLIDDPEGTEIVADARRKFLQDHLGAFVGALATRPTVVAHPVYGPLLAWCATLVAEECAREGVRPAPLDFFEQDDANEVANCGGCVTIPGMEGQGACGPTAR
ncbi:molecular chaperone TorD family protein [Myxococcota bacterium]|jgi:nitrate reductase assembly molybdenum cofactor insertion protein NarJ|nr:molecular chaperone TorD family protein [Myxococcota bacterium]